MYVKRNTYTRRRPYNRRPTAKKRGRALAKYRKPRIARPLRLRNNPQYDNLRIRVPITITANTLLTAPDSSKYFNFLHLPWSTLLSGEGESNAIGQASSDISKMTALYRYYKCSGVHYNLYRPKVYITNANGIQVFNQEQEFGYQIMHSKVVNKPDGVTTVIEANADLQRRVVLEEPNSWKECLDDDTRFKNCFNKKSIKMGWVPKTPFEKNWKNITQTDPELSVGGIHLRWKSDDVIPNLTGISMSSNQVVIQGTAIVYMKFYQRR